VLQHIAEGRLNKEISVSLTISQDTVKKHIKNIYRKINARNRIDAVHYALLLRSHKEYPMTISERVSSPV
jgi:DNA-binding NarL/FixJ family response regulator